MISSLPLRVRSSSQPLTMSSFDDPNFPPDVAVEILKRLPVESLLLCRCVCRSWRSTIDDPSFVALHLSHSALDASNWYLVCLDWCGLLQRLCSLFPGASSLTRPPLSKIEIPFAAPPKCYGFVGSCNGLICVTEISPNGYGRSLYLWNLFTRKHKVVRQSGPKHQFHCRGIAHGALGFGFNARSDDYRIVRILFLDHHSRCFGGTKPRVEIYSLSTDSWRSLECEVPALSGGSRFAVFLNGNLHWSASKIGNILGEGAYRPIVLFNVASEVFDTMALPEEIFQVDIVGLVSLAVLNDLLAVVIRHAVAAGHPKLHSTCSVWVMRDYGVPESWTKLYTFEISGLVTRFDGFTLNGELLMGIGFGKRVSWNPITGYVANLTLSTGCESVTVVDSLISL